MTGLLDGRGGMRTTPPEGVGLCSALPIERPPVDMAGWDSSGTGGSPPRPRVSPAGGRSVIEALERAREAWARRDWQQQLDLYPDALGAGHPTSVPPDSDPTGLARAEGAVQEADDGTAPS